jgi:hypothetical protein
MEGFKRGFASSGQPFRELMGSKELSSQSSSDGNALVGWSSCLSFQSGCNMVTCRINNINGSCVAYSWCLGHTRYSDQLQGYDKLVGSVGFTVILVFLCYCFC